MNEDCGPTQLYPTLANHSVITSPHLTGAFGEPSVGCAWRVTSPPGTATVFKFNVFRLPSTGRGKVVTIGEGSDTKNRFGGIGHSHNRRSLGGRGSSEALMEHHFGRCSWH